MANRYTEDNLAAQLKSVEITKRDADFNADNPPVSILNPMRMNFLKGALLIFDPKAFYDKILSIESNREVLKNELKYIFTLVIHIRGFKYAPNEILFDAVLKKYKLLSEQSLEETLLIFPDIFYNVIKKCVEGYPPIKNPILDVYTNFNTKHLNRGILGLLPKGKKYGGFVKALIHIESRETVHFSEPCFAVCRLLYHSSITPHNKREKWFDKLEIKESDCILWSKIFERFFPEHADIHKYFGQIA